MTHPRKSAGRGPASRCAAELFEQPGRRGPAEGRGGPVVHLGGDFGEPDGVCTRRTIIRPPLLTDDQPTGSYRTAVDAHLNGAKKISRGDLAAAMLDAVSDDSLIGAVMTVSK